MGVRETLASKADARKGRARSSHVTVEVTSLEGPADNRRNGKVLVYQEVVDDRKFEQENFNE